MPSYHTAMGQALVVNNLANNIIYTGPPPRGNAIQSCSAVILVNPANDCGAMYHYPAGPLTNNARTIIDNMATDVNPTEAWLYYGNTRGIGNTGAYDLSMYLLRHASSVKNRKATSGAVSVTVLNGVTRIATSFMNCGVNLTNAMAGGTNYGHLYM